jgi:hypothetical protein
MTMAVAVVAILEQETASLGEGWRVLAILLPAATL